MFPDLIVIPSDLARMVEEDAVALVADLRKKARFGGIYRIRDIKRRVGLAPPPDPRGIDHDILIESVAHIAKMMPVMRGGPFGADRGDRFQGGTIYQRVHKVMVILDSDSVHIHRGKPITRVYFYVL